MMTMVYFCNVFIMWIMLNRIWVAASGTLLLGLMDLAKLIQIDLSFGCASFRRCANAVVIFVDGVGFVFVAWLMWFGL